MKWVAAILVVVMATVGSVLPQCLSGNDAVPGDFSNLSGIVDFGFDLYRQTSWISASQATTTPSNFFFSPYSIWTALVLAYFGSAGNTKAELETVLRVTDKSSTLKIWRALEMFYQQRSASSPYIFKIANRAYFDPEVNLRPCIPTILYNEVKTLEFANLFGAADTINSFVSRTTNGLIPQIVEPMDMLDALMVLVNAVYFKGTWQYQFKPSDTKLENFYVTPTEPVQVPMMSISAMLRHGYSKDMRANVLELPYAGDGMSMLLLLPQEEGEAAFNGMVRALTADSLNRVMSDKNLRNNTVDLRLPKFKLEHKLETELQQGLENLGVRGLFSDDTALLDFDARGFLAVNKTIHKAFVEVSEEGTEAAAVTVLISYTRSSFRPRRFVFHCDRPFLFLIQDSQTRNVLFMGAYKNPRQ